MSCMSFPQFLVHTSNLSVSKCFSFKTSSFRDSTKTDWSPPVPIVEHKFVVDVLMRVFCEITNCIPAS